MNTWKSVTAYAAEHDLAIYKPLSGYHSLVEITTASGQHLSWCSNRVKHCYSDLRVIVQQRKLATLTNQELQQKVTEAKTLFM